MRIDAHHHLWDLSAVSYPWLEARGARRFFGDPTPIQQNYLVDEFRRDAEAVGVSASVHVQAGTPNGLPEARWVQSVHDGPGDGWFPAAQVAGCNLTATDLEVRLDALAELSTVRGIRQIVGRSPEEDLLTGTGSLLDDPAFEHGLRAVAARGWSFDLQLLPEQMTDAARLFEHVPELRVALCHAGSPHDRTPAGLRYWREQLSTLSANPTLVCKLSGLGMFEPGWTTESIAPIVDTVLEQFGTERCMIGSNFPVDSLTSGYADIWQAYEKLLGKLDPHEQSRVFQETCRQFYSIPEG